MATQVLKCERHGSATRLTCAECGKPICPKCSVRTEVGLKCEEHAKSAVTVKVPGRTRFLIPAGLVVLGIVALVLFIALRPGGQTGQRPKALAPVGGWRAVPDLSTIRGTTVSVALKDGRVLVAGGGVQAVPLNSAEIFDPKSGTWSATGPLTDPRRGHAAAALQDGRVLVTGGISQGELLASTEIYDPAGGTWSTVAPMSVGRLGHSLTLLADGTVLVAGGSSTEAAEGAGGGQTPRPDNSAEIFDPKTGTWSAAASQMENSRFEHTATLLDDGRVLIAGGLGGTGTDLRPLSTAEIYDPVAGTFTRSTALSEGRTNHAAVKLQDGSVLALGGDGGADADVSLTSAEVFDPRRGSWVSLEPLAQARSGHTLTLLSDGRVLVAAGESRSRGTRRSLATAEIYDLKVRRWAPAGKQMGCPRSEQAAALLADGSVLVVAGDATFPGKAPIAQSCAERYQP